VKNRYGEGILDGRFVILGNISSGGSAHVKLG